MIVDICLIILLDRRRGGTVSIVEAILVNSVGIELLVVMIREFMIVAILPDSRGTEPLVVVFTGCLNGISRASCLAGLLMSYVDIALVMDLVGTGSLGAKPSLSAVPKRDRSLG